MPKGMVKHSKKIQTELDISTRAGTGAVLRQMDKEVAKTNLAVAGGMAAKAIVATALGSIAGPMKKKKGKK